jgi:hypothetical protein
MRLFLALAYVILPTVLVAGWSGTCHAQDAVTDEARRRFQEGVRYYDQRQYDKSRLAFLQAYALKPHPAVLLNLAQSELRAGRHADAAGNFAKYIRENPNAEAMDHALAAFEEARKRVVEVNVAVNQPEAVITVDGQQVGKSPLPDPLYVDPGAHNIGAEREGARASNLLRAEAGQRLYVTLELKGVAAPAPAAAAGAGAGVAAAAGGEAADSESGQGFFEWLGDTPEAVATITVGGLALGTSAILAAFANKRYNDANEVRDLIMRTLREDLTENRILGAPTPCGPGGIANGMATFNSAIPQTVQDRRIAEYARACDAFTERSDSGDRLKIFSFVSLGVGVAATLATIVWYFTDTSSGPPQPGTRRSKKLTSVLEGGVLMPVIAPNTQGLWFQANF